MKIMYIFFMIKAFRSTHYIRDTLHYPLSFHRSISGPAASYTGSLERRVPVGRWPFAGFPTVHIILLVVGKGSDIWEIPIGSQVLLGRSRRIRPTSAFPEITMRAPVSFDNSACE